MYILCVYVYVYKRERPSSLSKNETKAISEEWRRVLTIAALPTLIACIAQPSHTKDQLDRSSTNVGRYSYSLWPYRYATIEKESEYFSGSAGF